MIKRSFELKADSDKESALRGCAFRFSEVADGFFGKEKFSEDLEVKMADSGVFLLRDHDHGKLLGREGVNLKVKTEKSGLYFELKSWPDTELAKETRELVKDKILNGASVGFRAEKETIENEIRVFNKIMLYEISLVSRAYYQSSKVEARKESEGECLPPEMF